MKVNIFVLFFQDELSFFGTFDDYVTDTEDQIVMFNYGIACSIDEMVFFKTMIFFKICFPLYFYFFFLFYSTFLSTYSFVKFILNTFLFLRFLRLISFIYIFSKCPTRKILLFYFIILFLRHIEFNNSSSTLSHRRVKYNDML